MIYFWRVFLIVDIGSCFGIWLSLLKCIKNVKELFLLFVVRNLEKIELDGFYRKEENLNGFLIFFLILRV